MQIKVCGAPFEVSFVDGANAVSHTSKRHYLYGETSFDNESIRIDKTISLEMINQTFWHEVMHVIAERLKIRELMNEEGDHLEFPIDQIATGIFTVLNSINQNVIKERP